ncbi:MAG: endonuclease V [Fidelibacterota bacterium]|nr:MAG: endonuclease V [Candidatus Neomarinimicrobiota bacterium]
MTDWPTTPDELIQAQEGLRQQSASLWRPGDSPFEAGACFVCFVPGLSPTGAEGDAGWAGAVLWRDSQLIAESIIRGVAGAAYRPGLLALREGPLLEAAVSSLPRPPDVLLVSATGRDHPRRSGLAFHLGAILDVPTIGVTNRPLLAQGEWPAPDRGSTSPLRIEGEEAGVWLRTRSGAHPLAVHPAWRTDVETCVKVVLAVSIRVRTPEPLRQARRLARTARAKDQREDLSG